MNSRGGDTNGDGSARPRSPATGAASSLGHRQQLADLAVRAQVLHATDGVSAANW